MTKLFCCEFKLIGGCNLNYSGFILLCCFSWSIHAADSSSSLTAQAGDPTAPLMQLQLTNFYVPNYHNGEGYANQIQFQPVIPVAKNDFIDLNQIYRITVPLMTTPGPNRKSGLSDITLQGIAVVDKKSWGFLGVGVSAVLPTASDDLLGAGKWQIGPAVSTMYYGIENWQVGFVWENTVSFAGDSSRDSVNTMNLQPIINYLYGDWYIGIGDFNWTYDWKAHETFIPLGLQVGKIMKLGEHRYNISAEFEWTAHHSKGAAVPDWGIKLGIVLLLPEN
jgi:hypothetical protein